MHSLNQTMETPQKCVHRVSGVVTAPVSQYEAGFAGRQPVHNVPTVPGIEQASRKQKTNLLQLFMLRGLGEYLMLYPGEHKTILGKLTRTNGKYMIRDEGYLTGIKADSLLTCWNNGILGAVGSKTDTPWNCLTFYGLEHCDLKVDLGETAHLALQAAENQYGDHLVDFTGSIYRGFKLMLENNFLPVILPTQIRMKTGENGLAVCDLRAAPLPISVIQTVNNVVNANIQKHLETGVDDLEINPEQFNSMFHDYLPKSKVRTG